MALTRATKKRPLPERERSEQSKDALTPLPRPAPRRASLLGSRDAVEQPQQQALILGTQIAADLALMGADHVLEPLQQPLSIGREPERVRASVGRRRRAQHQPAAFEAVDHRDHG